MHIGWESQLLEVGFLSIFMCPLFNMEKYPKHTPTSWVTVWGNRWMIFRIMIGAVSYSVYAHLMKNHNTAYKE